MKNNKRRGLYILIIIMIFFTILLYMVMKNTDSKKSQGVSSNDDEIITTIDPKGELPTVPIITDNGCNEQAGKAHKNSNSDRGKGSQVSPTNGTDNSLDESQKSSDTSLPKTNSSTKKPVSPKTNETDKTKDTINNNQEDVDGTPASTNADSQKDSSRGDEYPKKDHVSKSEDGQKHSSTPTPEKKNSDAIELPFVPAS